MGNQQACCNCEDKNGPNAEEVTAESKSATKVQQMEAWQQPPPLPNTKSAESGMATPRTPRTAQEAVDTLNECSTTTRKKQQSIQAYTRAFVKEMIQGVEVTLVTTAIDKQEPLRMAAMSSFDSTVTNLLLKGEGGNILCPLAKITNVMQIEDGKDNLPAKVAESLSEEELDSMLLVKYKQEDDTIKGFVMIQPTVDERKRVYQSLKVLHQHAVKSIETGQEPGKTPLHTPRGSPQGSPRSTSRASEE